MVDKTSLDNKNNTIFFAFCHLTGITFEKKPKENRAFLVISVAASTSYLKWSTPKTAFLMQSEQNLKRKKKTKNWRESSTLWRLCLKTFRQCLLNEYTNQKKTNHFTIARGDNLLRSKAAKGPLVSGNNNKIATFSDKKWKTYNSLTKHKNACCILVHYSITKNAFSSTNKKENLVVLQPKSLNLRLRFCQFCPQFTSIRYL